MYRISSVMIAIYTTVVIYCQDGITGYYVILKLHALDNKLLTNDIDWG